MKIHIEKDIEVPKGFYCSYNDICDHRQDNICRAFHDKVEFHKETTRYIKCPACLLACRESLMEG